jgi:hypothetical protein
MALQLKFTICQTPTCTKLEFKEETGSYDVSSNPGGYDETFSVPANPATSEFEEAVLQITTPSNMVYTFDVYPAWPTISTTNYYTINGTDLGFIDNKIVDGLYEVVYTITSDTEEYVASNYFLFTCQIDCCIDKLYGKVTPENSCCDCESNNYLKAAMDAEGYVCAAKNALACGKLNLVKTFIAKAQSVCANLKCKCC